MKDFECKAIERHCTGMIWTFIFSNVSGYGIELFEKEAKNHLGVMQIVTGGVEQNDSMATKKEKVNTFEK